MGVTNATRENPMVLTTFMEMLITNAQGREAAMMMHDVSLNIVFYRFNYLMFLVILC